MITALPVIHNNMEFAAEVRKAIFALRPDCIAVELPETMQSALLTAAARLPDLTAIVSFNQINEPLYLLAEPCDAHFEALRTAEEEKIDAFCIDLDVDGYDLHTDLLPDPYSITRIGLARYYKAYLDEEKKHPKRISPFDEARELHMAKRLKELSLRYEKVLFVSGMHHVERVLQLTERSHFPEEKQRTREVIKLFSLTESSMREVMSECGYFTTAYEKARDTVPYTPPDRGELILSLYKEAKEPYEKNSRAHFASYHLRTLMKFAKNLSAVKGALLPDLFQILTAAKGCVEHNFAYEVWEIATDYAYLKNVDNLEELDLSPEDLWGSKRSIQFHLRERGRKDFLSMHRARKRRAEERFEPPSPFSICSYPPEDLIVEKFGDFLKKRGKQITLEEMAKTIPFTTSLEDGIDTRETIRHFLEHKLYVKTKGKPQGDVGSIVIIFDEDEETPEKYPWKTTWLGEHSQESDMSFYATDMGRDVVGPGISRCEYGGFMMSYPPRRMYNLWDDPDYVECRTKAEVLLMAAVDYSMKPLITYVAAKPPRSQLKSFARRFGKKIVYLPIGQLAPTTIKKIRLFHVLDSHERRKIADDYLC